MLIGVISDTHGNVSALRRALEFFDGADMIVHAGDVLYHPPRLGCGEGYDIPAFVDVLNGLDIPILIAQGNCDSQVYEELLKMPVQSPYAYASLNGIRIVVNHGHMLVRSQMIELGKRYKADYFISGHTHIPVLENVDGVTLLNPGSPSIPKYEVNGRPAPSVGIITEDEARVINVEDGSLIAKTQ
ncbi:MAG: phosphodiesterase [Armatimonadetes bacterium]|nr:phosphodiesterase [Armatimonadota bacterium]